MDPASAVAFFGFAVQVLQGIIYVQKFLRDIQDAPKTVQKLVVELSLVGDIIRKITVDSQAFTFSNDVCKIAQTAVRLIKGRVDALSELIKTCSSSQPSRTRRLWKSLNMAFQKEKFVDCLADLERAKGMLQLAMSLIRSELEKYQRATLDQLQQGFLALQKTQLAMATAVDKSYFVIQQLNDAVSHSVLSSTTNSITEVAKLDLVQSLRHETQHSGSLLNVFDQPNSVHYIASNPECCNLLNGAISIMRQRLVSKSWDSEQQKFNLHADSWISEVKLKHIPWILSSGISIRLEILQALFGRPKLNITLEPIRYVRIPDEVMMAIGGKLLDLRRLLSEGTVSLYDRDAMTGMNLLDLTLGKMSWYYCYSMMSPQPFLDVIKWLASQGLTTRLGTGDPEDPLGDHSSYLSGLHGGADPPHLERKFEYELGKFLIESSSMPPIVLAKTLLRFRLDYPAESRYLERHILDLVAESPWDKHCQNLEVEQRKYLASGRKLSVDYTFVSVVLLAIMKVKQLRAVTSASDSMVKCHTQALKVARQFIMDRVTEYDPEALIRTDPAEYSHLIDYLATFLRLYKAASILDNGFGTFLAQYACRMHLLRYCYVILKESNYEAETFIAEHIANEVHIQPSLRISFATDDASTLSEPQFVMITGRDPHISDDKETRSAWDFLESCYQTIYDSQKSAEVMHDVCA
ncbi:hypothetical protein MMC06_006867, partial [Schaereria dolodes]|nr:hypothetical protein [Schaereria dolodes]